jgi:GT2 family glycosyltransferase
MLFSVVIPTHKRKKLLELLLSSLEQQSFAKDNFEVIVIATQDDEALQINTTNFAINLSICPLKNDPLNGRSASAKRNFAVSKAQGQWIAFTDDDCIVDSQWLSEASQIIKDKEIDFLEGYVNIPVPEVKSFTYKGIQRLSRPNGYQTCNMFYKKKDFLELGGFDRHFPFYLEDTDLGWTFIENNKKYDYSNKVIISHPVPKAQPQKMLESSMRMAKIPYLYKKHPDTFKKSKMRAYPRSYLILLVVDFLIFLTFLFFPKLIILSLIIRFVFTKMILLRMLEDCEYELNEALKMYGYLLICPLISFFQLLKGNLINFTWIFFK